MKIKIYGNFVSEKDLRFFCTKSIFEQQQNTKIPGAASATGAAGAASKSVGAGQKAPDPGPTKLAGALGRVFSIQNLGSLGEAGESHLGMG